MTRTNHHRPVRSASAFIMMLMLLAFAVKALIPAGFMPDYGNGFMKLVICSGMGEKTILVPASDNSPHDQGTELSDEHCAYQTLTFANHVPVPAIFTITAGTFINLPTPRTQTPLLADLHAHSIAARGPPSLLI